MEWLLSTQGFLLNYPEHLTYYIIGGISVFLALGFTGAHLLLWTLFIADLLWGFNVSQTVWVIFGTIALVFNFPPLRQNLVSRPIMSLLKSIGFLPEISETERIALNAGTKWIDTEYFSGKPNWSRILKENYPTLTEKEKAFLDGPTHTLCGMATDWVDSRLYRRKRI